MSRISPRLFVVASVAVVLLATLASGMITLNGEDFPSAYFVTIPTTLLFLLISAVYLVKFGRKYLLCCLALSFSPAIGCWGAFKWVDLNTRLFRDRVVAVDTSEWNRGAGMGSEAPSKLEPEKVCIYHWSPLFKRLATFNERGELDLVIDVEERGGKLVVTHTTRVLFISSGDTGVWPNR